jgi:hypothetical protein
MEFEKLKAVISLIYKFAHANITSYQLAKALYLTDYLSIKFREKPILGLEFRYHYYGPYPKEAMTKLKEEQFLKTETRQSRGGHFTYLKHPSYFLNHDLDAEEQRIIFLATKVVKEKSSRGVKELNDFIYATEPMKGAVKGQVIKMHHALGRKKIDLLKKRLVDKDLSYYVTFPKGLDKAEKEFLQQTDTLFTENPPK